jgi:hypothetical protein
MKRYFSRAAQRLDDPISIASASLPQKRRDIKDEWILFIGFALIVTSPE